MKAHKKHNKWLLLIVIFFTNLIKFHYIGHMVFFFQLLLPLQQCVHAVVAAADLLVVLFFQHGGHTAEAADAASPGAHTTAAATSCWGRLTLTRASGHTQGLTGPINQLFCEHFTAVRHKWKNLSKMTVTIFMFWSYIRAKGKGTNSMHFLHMMDPQRRQWCRLFRMLNLFPQSGQNGTSESFTHDTTDFSIAVKENQQTLIYNYT